MFFLKVISFSISFVIFMVNILPYFILRCFMFFYYICHYIFYFIILLCLTTPFKKLQVTWITQEYSLISSHSYFAWWFVSSIILNGSVRGSLDVYLDVCHGFLQILRHQYKKSDIFLYFKVFAISLLSSLLIIYLSVASFTSSSLTECVEKMI